MSCVINYRTSIIVGRPSQSQWPNDSLAEQGPADNQSSRGSDYIKAPQIGMKGPHPGPVWFCKSVSYYRALAGSD